MGSSHTDIDSIRADEYNEPEMRYYYSTQPFLAWCLNTYFYKKRHFAYIAPFHAYRLINPKSSNPYDIYQDLYKPWKDNDEYDKYINQIRINLKKGVEKRVTTTGIEHASKKELEDICDRVEILFFYPIVYRVNIEATAVGRKLQPTDWSKKGSVEHQIDLDDGEFDLLFLDFDTDNDFNRLKDNGKTTANDTLKIFKSRCKP